jgi:hypothetical protein
VLVIPLERALECDRSATHDRSDPLPAGRHA